MTNNRKEWRKIKTRNCYLSPKYVNNTNYLVAKLKKIDSRSQKRVIYFLGQSSAVFLLTDWWQSASITGTNAQVCGMPILYNITQHVASIQIYRPLQIYKALLRTDYILLERSTKNQDYYLYQYFFCNLYIHSLTTMKNHVWSHRSKYLCGFPQLWVLFLTRIQPEILGSTSIHACKIEPSFWFNIIAKCFLQSSIRCSFLINCFVNKFDRLRTFPQFNSIIRQNKVIRVSILNLMSIYFKMAHFDLTLFVLSRCVTSFVTKLSYNYQF